MTRHWDRAFGWIVALLLAATYQLLLFGHGRLDLWEPEWLDGTFNSMLLHLLQGDAFVSREAIGFESFTRNGHVTAYFGIVPALLRAPALLVGAGFEALHLARLSCSLAGGFFLCLGGAILATAHASLPPASRSRVLLWSVGLAGLFGGPVVYVANSAYLYSEPVLWGAVFVAGFNLVVLRAVLAPRALTGGELSLLAALAGLALNTRPSAGFDLTLGFGLIWLWMVFSTFRAGQLRPAGLLLAALVMAAGLGVAGVINWARWGSPLTFADFAYYDIAHRYPERLANILHYGTFNVERIPISASYYLAGIPYVLKHVAATAAFLARFYDALEGPPDSPFLTSPLWTFLALVGLRPMFRHAPAVGACIGHLAAALVLFMAMTLTLRYRMDLAGLAMLPAAFGYRAVSLWASAAVPRRRRQMLSLAAAFCAFGIATSFYILVLAKILNPAVPVEVRCGLQPLAPFVPVNEAASLPPGCHGDTSTIAR